MPRFLLILAMLLSAPAALALECIDYSRPVPPLLLASHAVTESVRLVAADGDYLCWAGGSGTNPLTRLHWCRTGTDGSLEELAAYILKRDGSVYQPNYLCVTGHRVVVGDERGGWQVIEFRSPGVPTGLWEALPGSAIGGPVLWGDRLLVPTAAGLEIHDLSPGAAPVRLALLPLSPGDPYHEPPYLAKLAIAGDRCWVATAHGEYGYQRVFLFTVDLSTPALPVAGPALRLPYDGDEFYLRSLVADGDQVLATVMVRKYLVRSMSYADTHEARLFGTDGAGFPVLRFSAKLTRAGDAGLSDGLAWAAEWTTLRYFERRDGGWDIREAVATGNLPRLAVGGAALWTGSGPELRAWSRTIPAASPLLSVAYWPEQNWCLRLYSVGERLYSKEFSLTPDYHLGSSGALTELDTSDPLRLRASPYFNGMYPELWCNIVGSHAYSISGICDLTTHTMVNGTAPFVIGGAGQALFAWESPGVMVTWDATDPAHPVRHRSCFAIWDCNWGSVPVDIAAGYAVFAQKDTLICADITSPLEPLVVDRLVLPGTEIREMALADGLLSVAHDDGLTLVELDAGGRLTVRASVAVPADGLGALAMDGSLLYATASIGGRLMVFDVSDREAPTLIAEPGVFGTQPFLHGDMLYMASPRVSALRRQCSASVPVALTDLHLVWRDGAARLTWHLDADLAAVRVLARAGGREWFVPWSADGTGNVAVDDRAPRGAVVDYLIQVLQDDGQWLTLAEESLSVPAALLSLAAPVPNPFNPETTIAFSLDVTGPVEITVADAAGRVLRTLASDRREAGDHRIIWRGDDDAGLPVAAGTYFVRLVTAHGVRAVKATLVK